MRNKNVKSELVIKTQTKKCDSNNTKKNMKKSYYIFVKEDSTSKSNGNYTTFQQSTGDE